MCKHNSPNLFIRNDIYLDIYDLDEVKLHKEKKLDEQDLSDERGCCIYCLEEDSLFNIKINDIYNMYFDKIVDDTFKLEFIPSVPNFLQKNDDNKSGDASDNKSGDTSDNKSGDASDNVEFDYSYKEYRRNKKEYKYPLRRIFRKLWNTKC